MSGDTFLKTCNADIELLTDREHLEMTENMIRGGVASVFSKRFFKANNKYQMSFSPDEESTFGFRVDAKNLYCGVMEKLPLPSKDFRKVNVTLAEIKRPQHEAHSDRIVSKWQKKVVFRATRDILPFEQLRFDYNDPIANQLFQEVSQPIFD